MLKAIWCGVVVGASLASTACRTETGESRITIGAPPDGPACQATTAPCDVYLQPVAVLRSSSGSGDTDPGTQLVQLSDATFISTAAYGVHLIEWSAAGESLRTVGRAGEGPGEFQQRGAPLLFTGPGDSTWVLDGGGRWSVLDPDLNFVRTFAAPQLGRERKAIHVKEDSYLLFTADADPPTILFSPAGSRVTGQRGQAARPRISTPDGAGNFWIAPPDGPAKAHSLERWSAAGERNARIPLDFEWLKSDSEQTGAFPHFESIHQDPAGFIWLIIVVPEDGSHPTTTEVAKDAFDAWLIAIDTRSGATVVRYRYDGPPAPPPPLSRFLSGQSRSYTSVSDSVGIKEIHVYDVRMAGRS